MGCYLLAVFTVFMLVFLGVIIVGYILGTRTDELDGPPPRHRP